MTVNRKSLIEELNRVISERSEFEIGANNKDYYYATVSYGFLTEIHNKLLQTNDLEVEIAKLRNDIFVKDNSDRQTKYAVYRSGASAPSVYHDTIEIAEAEAKRIAEKLIGFEVFVVKVCSSFKLQQKLETIYKKY